MQTSQNTSLETARLGATGIEVTRLGAGGHFTNGPLNHHDIPRRVRELNHILDLGVTYIDVQWAPEEEATAEVMKTRKDEFTVAWPLHGITPRAQTGELTEQYILDYCEDHRVRYGIDHVDFLLWVGLEMFDETQDRVMEVLRSAFAKLKAQGFCDHLSFSCHHSPEMALRTIERYDDFSMIMFPYSPLHPAAETALLPAAEAKGIGTVAMKVFGGGGGYLNQIWSGEVSRTETSEWHQSARPYQAALRWVLRNSDVDTTVPAGHSIQQIDELYEAVQHDLTEEDERILSVLKEQMHVTEAPCQLRHSGQPGAWD